MRGQCRPVPDRAFPAYRRARHGVGIFLRLDAGIFHGEVREERRFGAIERDAHGIIVDLLHRLEQFRQAHIVEIGMIGTRHLEIGIVVLPLPLDRKHDVVGVENRGSA